METTTTTVESHGYSAVGFIPLLIILALVVVPYWKIWSRTGHAGAWGLLMLIPLWRPLLAITVHEELAGDWLRSVPDGSLGAIITTHVLEHLELDDMIELLELAAVKLGPDSVFISETPNPSSLIVLGNSYLLDPTHVRPLHPSLLAFLCEKAGFRDVRLRFFSPAEDYHLPMTELGEDAPDWARELAGSVNRGFSTLNEVLFGPQDYAVVARTPPAPES